MYLYDIGNEAAGDHAVSSWEGEKKKDLHKLRSVCLSVTPSTDDDFSEWSTSPRSCSLITASIVCSITDAQVEQLGVCVRAGLCGLLHCLM